MPWALFDEFAHRFQWIWLYLMDFIWNLLDLELNTNWNFLGKSGDAVGYLAWSELLVCLIWVFLYQLRFSLLAVPLHLRTRPLGAIFASRCGFANKTRGYNFRIKTPELKSDRSCLLALLRSCLGAVFGPVFLQRFSSYRATLPRSPKIRTSF